MGELIERLGDLSVAKRLRKRPREDAYGTLLRAIVGQQFSTKAAATIYGRVQEHFAGRTPTPQEVLDADTDALRACGLSGRKVEYVQDLARHVASGELEVDRFGRLSDEELIEEITAVRGLGVWTAHMFMMFHLQRPDILPVGDLGIRAAARNEYGLDDLPTPAELEEIAEAWRPHRTLACIYLWGSLHNEPEV
jgi:DNA-3-methyladenine glycosylase II